MRLHRVTAEACARADGADAVAGQRTRRPSQAGSRDLTKVDLNLNAVFSTAFACNPTPKKKMFALFHGDDILCAVQRLILFQRMVSQERRFRAELAVWQSGEGKERDKDKMNFDNAVQVRKLQLDIDDLKSQLGPSSR